MAKNKKILLGIVSFLPIILLLIYLGSFMAFFVSVIPQIDHEEEPEFLFANMIWIIGFAIIMGIVSLGAFVYFLIHAIRNTNLDSSERLAWILIFIFASIVGYPIYWYMKIWKEPASM